MIKQFFEGFKEGFFEFGKNISAIINLIVLSSVYFIGISLTSIIAKIFRKHFLDLNTSKKKTYWSDLKLKKEKMEKYYRQF